jgi:nicotinamidase/pyrazinamidase
MTSETEGFEPRPGDALLLVDIQNDFLPGGALAVAEGDAVIPVANRYVADFERAGLPIYLTRDWHPADHCSFEAEGGPWPPHCVQDTAGAAFADALHVPEGAVVHSKAMDSDKEAYSDFEDQDFSARLRAAGVRRLLVMGLATDYCVLATVRDALSAGFEVVVATDGVRAVDVEPGDGERALASMRKAGAVLLGG